MGAPDPSGMSVYVRSVDAIGAFRSAYILHAAKAKPLVEDAWDEIARTREWLQSDRRMHWESEVRRRRRKLEEAQQTLFSARFSALTSATAAEQLAVQSARRALAEAEEKLANVRKWIQKFNDVASPMLKQLEELRSILTVDQVKGAAYLANVIRALESYSESSIPLTQAQPDLETADIHPKTPRASEAEAPAGGDDER